MNTLGASVSESVVSAESSDISIGYIMPGWDTTNLYYACDSYELLTMQIRLSVCRNSLGLE